MIVEEVMTSDPYAAAVTASIRQVLQMLAEADVRHLPIVDGHRLAGIVSDRDLRAVTPGALAALERPLEVDRVLSRPIANVMNGDVLFVHPMSELVEAIDLMIEHKIGAVPVVEPASLELVGIVSYVDALRAAREYL